MKKVVLSVKIADHPNAVKLSGVPGLGNYYKSAGAFRSTLFHIINYANIDKCMRLRLRLRLRLRRSP